MFQALPNIVSILHSKQFTFFIGPNEEPIPLHAGAIGVLSSPLERLVNGPMKEAQDNIACFPTLKVSDFDRICEFAYRGNYTDPDVAIFDEAEVNKRHRGPHLELQYCKCSIRLSYQNSCYRLLG
jgi:hypothetical protein